MATRSEQALQGDGDRLSSAFGGDSTTTLHLTGVLEKRFQRTRSISTSRLSIEGRAVNKKYVQHAHRRLVKVYWGSASQATEA